MQDKRINDFTDKELADMVRGSLYVKGTNFGEGPLDCRFLLVMAVPYGNDEGVDTIADAIEGFQRLFAKRKCIADIAKCAGPSKADHTTIQMRAARSCAFIARAFWLSAGAPKASSARCAAMVAMRGFAN